MLCQSPIARVLPICHASPTTTIASSRACLLPGPGPGRQAMHAHAPSLYGATATYRGSSDFDRACMPTRRNLLQLQREAADSFACSAWGSSACCTRTCMHARRPAGRTETDGGAAAVSCCCWLLVLGGLLLWLLPAGASSEKQSTANPTACFASTAPYLCLLPHCSIYITGSYY